MEVEIEIEVKDPSRLWRLEPYPVHPFHKRRKS